MDSSWLSEPGFPDRLAGFSGRKNAYEPQGDSGGTQAHTLAVIIVHHHRAVRCENNEHRPSFASAIRSLPSQVNEPVSEPPLLDVLSGNARRNIPAMKLDVHTHSGEAGQRFVVINGRRYREGERLEEGPILEAITVNGATLRQGRQRFQLPVR